MYQQSQVIVTWLFEYRPCKNLESKAMAFPVQGLRQPGATITYQYHPDMYNNSTRLASASLFTVFQVSL